MKRSSQSTYNGSDIFCGFVTFSFENEEELLSQRTRVDLEKYFLQTFRYKHFIVIRPRNYSVIDYLVTIMDGNEYFSLVLKELT